MFRLLVIGKTEPIAKEIALWAVMGENVGNKYGKRYEVSGRSAFVRAFPLWTSMKGAPAIGDAVLLVAKTPEDLPAMESFVKSYKKIPLKFILYDGIPEQPDFNAKFAAKPIMKGTPMEFVEKLIADNNELVKAIATMFKKFDKDGNGFIELKELKAISKELGTELNEEEAAAMVKIMDTNKDGMISLEEFITWWKTGCQGTSQRIISLIKGMSHKFPIVHQILESLKTLKSPPPTDKTINANFGIYLNRVKNPKLSVGITLMSNGIALDSELQPYMEAIGVTKEDNFLGIAFDAQDGKKSCATLEEVAKAAVLMGTSLSKKAAEAMSNMELKYGSTTNKAILCALPSVKGNTNMAPAMPYLEALSGAILPNESLTLKLDFATDLEKIATEERPFIDLLFDGLNFDINGKLNPFIRERIHEVIERLKQMDLIPAQIQSSVSQHAVSPMMSSLKGEIEFDPTLPLKESFKEIMGEELYLTSLKILRDAFGPQIKEQIAAIPILEMLQTFLKDGISGIKILHYISGLGAIKISLNLPGLDPFLTF